MCLCVWCVGLRACPLYMCVYVCMCVCVRSCLKERKREDFVCVFIYTYVDTFGVSTVSRLLKIIGLFCQRAL